MKYGFDGQPTSWATREQFIILFLIFISFTDGLIVGLSRIVGRDPTLQWVNIPNKAYWRQPSNRTEGLKRVNHLLNGVLLFVNTLILGVVLLTRVSLSGQIVNFFLGVVFLASAYLIFWSYRLFKAT